MFVVVGVDNVRGSASWAGEDGGGAEVTGEAVVEEAGEVGTEGRAGGVLVVEHVEEAEVGLLGDVFGE